MATDRKEIFKAEMAKMIRQAKKRGIDVAELVREIEGGVSATASPSALEYFREKGAEGGKAASKHMSAKERSDRARKAALARHGKAGK